MKKAVKIFRLLIFIISVGFMISSCNEKDDPKPIVDEEPEEEPDEEEEPEPGDVSEWATAAAASHETIRKEYYYISGNYYNQNNSGHTGYNYWWHAHVFDVLIDAYNRTGDEIYVDRMEQLLAGMKMKDARGNGSLWNTFYDDMEWMALACIRAYQATGNPVYLTEAKQLHEWIIGGWSEVHGGGIAWAGGSPNSKNACSNAPAVIIAARLYQETNDPHYQEWALKIYDWIQEYLLDEKGLLKDGVGNEQESWKFTYNQGTYIGATMELYNSTGDEEFLYEAKRTANYVVNDRERLAPEGIILPGGAGDGGLFNGIFIRYLTQLTMHEDLDKSTRDSYIKYLVANGNSLLTKATLKPAFIFNKDWRTMPPNKDSDLSIQLSGLMLMESLDELVREGFLEE